MTRPPPTLAATPAARQTGGRVGPLPRRALLVFIAAGLLAAATNSIAAGLGKGQLNSQLGQALDLQFEVLASSEENVSERCFRLTAPLDRDPSSEDIIRGNFSLEKTAGERTLLRLKSNAPVREPVISVTIRFDCGSGPVVRRYTFLPDFKLPTKLGAAAPNVPDKAAASVAGPATAPPANTLAASRGETPRPPAALSPLAKPAPVARRRSRDRVSLNALAPNWRDGIAGIDNPLRLKMSPLLDLSRPHQEKSPQQAAIDALERRLADLDTAPETSQLSPEQRLQQLIALLGEAQAIAARMPPPVNLPKVAELPAIPSVPSVPTASTAPTASPSTTTAAPTDAVAPSPTPPEKKRPAPPAPAEEASVPGETIGIVAALLILVAGTAFILWRRARSLARKPLRRAAKNAPEAATDDSLFAADVPGNDIFRHAAPAAAAQGVDPLLDSVSSISVSHGFEEDFDDPFTAHLEAAEIMICFGRFQSAAAEVLAYIDDNPDCGLRPRLALLDIYRRGEMRAAFETTANSMSGQFNIALPEWQGTQQTAMTTRNLDHFPHIIARITELWTSDDCLAYVQHLTTDTRGGTRSGFDLDAAEELALLEAMLRLRTSSSDSAAVPA